MIDQINLMDVLRSSRQGKPRRSQTCQLMRSLAVGRSIKACGSIGIDGTNILGGSFYRKLKNIYNDVTCNDDKFIEKAYRLLNQNISTFIKNIQPFLRRVKCYIVFDGLKPKLKKQKDQKTYHEKKQTEESSSNSTKEENTTFERSRNFCSYYFDELHPRMLATIMVNLEELNIGKKVEDYDYTPIMSPYEADHSIVKLLRDNIISCVHSKDYGYLFSGVPLVTNASNKNPNYCWIIDLETADISKSENIRLARFVTAIRKDENKKAIFGVLSGYGYIESFERVLPIIEIMDYVGRCESLSHFFAILREEREELKIHEDYEKDAEKALLDFKFAPCWSLYSQEWEYLDDEGGLKKYGQKVWEKEEDLCYPFTLAKSLGRLSLRYGTPNEQKVLVKGNTQMERIDDLTTRRHWCSPPKKQPLNNDLSLTKTNDSNRGISIIN